MLISSYFRSPTLLPQLILGMGVITMLLSGCGEEKNEAEKESLPLNPAVSKSQLRGEEKMILVQGKKLTQKYCVFCHEPPDPSVLPRESWPEIMRSMNMLFVHRNRMPQISSKIPHDFEYRSDEYIKIGRYMMMSAKPQKELLAIKVDESEILPDRLIERFRTPIAERTVETMFRYHPKDDLFSFGLADEKGYRMQLFSGNFSPLAEYQTKEAVIDIELHGNRCFLTTMGGMDMDNGKSEIIDLNFKSGAEQVRTIPDVSRSIDLLHGDFDDDGSEDILHVGFGDNSGKGEIVILWGKKSGSYVRESLLKRSGGLRAKVVDLNRDDREDFLILFAQNYQEMLYFKNLGDRQFELEQIIRRPVGWGYMDFDYVDMNGDQHKDIVTLVGNNMELDSKPYKPYHGIYIWENNGENQFEESSFSPMMGASQLLVGDFNGDKLMDFASTSLAPDWSLKNPLTFAMWLQDSKGAFSQHTLSEESWGRYCFMIKKTKPSHDELWLMSSSLPIALPPKPSPRLLESLKAPSYFLKFNLKDYRSNLK